MKLLLVVFISVFACTAAWATVYEWIDSQGVVHMTDDPDKVPDRYRSKVKSREIDTGGVTPPAADSGNQPAAGPAPAAKADARDGGHDEEWWRAGFAQARREIKSLQDQIDTKKKSLEDLHRKRVLYQKPGDRIEYFSLSDDIARDEERLKSLQDQLGRLNDKADGAAVPLEWRQ
jgi:hypothetical protein